MNDAELNRIVDAWVAGQEAEEGTPERERNYWAIDQVWDWSIEGEAEQLWQFILVTYQRDISQSVIGMLAAGPLEELLAEYGPAYIERVERLAERDEKFNRLLGGVWRNSMTDEVWERIRSARKEVW